MSELCQVKGIGEKTAEKLIEHDIKTIADLAVRRPEEISQILGCNRLKALEIINDAKEKGLGEIIKFLNLKQFNEEITSKIIFYSTGSMALDNLLKGGIATNEITGLKGYFSTGKTQIAKTASLSCVEKGRSVAWIETEPGTFKDQRILEIAKSRNIEIDLENDYLIFSAKSILSPNHQFLTYERINRELEKGRDIGMIVIDSFSSKFREFYIGRESFTSRSQETGRHLGYLQYLAARYNLAVLITVQVMGIPDASKSLETMMMESSDEAMYGGHILKHGVQTWISLEKKSKTQGLWEATLFDSSWIKGDTVQFTIDSLGVRDIVAKKGAG